MGENISLTVVLVLFTILGGAVGRNHVPLHSLISTRDVRDRVLSDAR